MATRMCCSWIFTKGQLSATSSHLKKLDSLSTECSGNGSNTQNPLHHWLFHLLPINQMGSPSTIIVSPEKSTFSSFKFFSDLYRDCVSQYIIYGNIWQSAFNEHKPTSLRQKFLFQLANLLSNNSITKSKVPVSLYFEPRETPKYFKGSLAVLQPTN